MFNKPVSGYKAEFINQRIIIVEKKSFREFVEC